MKYSQDTIDALIEDLIEYFEDYKPDHTWYQKTVSNMLEEKSVFEMCMYLHHEDVGIVDWDYVYYLVLKHTIGSV